MCNVRSGLIVIVCIFLLVSLSQAFDGQRKGFVIGGGLDSPFFLPGHLLQSLMNPEAELAEIS